LEEALLPLAARWPAAAFVRPDVDTAFGLALAIGVIELLVSPSTAGAVPPSAFRTASARVNAPFATRRGLSGRSFYSEGV
jgi:hypothetical protein